MRSSSTRQPRELPRPRLSERSPGERARPAFGWPPRGGRPLPQRRLEIVTTHQRRNLRLGQPRAPAARLPRWAGPRNWVLFASRLPTPRAATATAKPGPRQLVAARARPRRYRPARTSLRGLRRLRLRVPSGRNRGAGWPVEIELPASTSTGQGGTVDPGRYIRDAKLSTRSRRRRPGPRGSAVFVPSFEANGRAAAPKTCRVALGFDQQRRGCDLAVRPSTPTATTTPAVVHPPPDGTCRHRAEHVLHL